ncbi:hypothetical protein ABZ485_17855 [Streptomyces albogriseolus]|uniref:hypothetical protein n=1 Tax=Streptomyces albogriseolus TaxID=1887 RepID=UPI00346123E7
MGQHLDRLVVDPDRRVFREHLLRSAVRLDAAEAEDRDAVGVGGEAEVTEAPSA